MKPLLAFFVMVAAAAAAEPLEFMAVMSDSSGVRISVRETESGRSQWLRTGESFLRYEFTAYDAPNETAVLAKDGVEIRLGLVTAKIKNLSSGAKLTPAIAKSIFHNLRQIWAASDQYYLENAKLAVTLDQLVGPDKYIKRLVDVAGEDYSTITLKQGMPVTITTAAGETIAADDEGGLDVVYAFHALRPGETGAQVAKRANITIADLQALNDDVDWSKLKVGQVVRVK